MRLLATFRALARRVTPRSNHVQPDVAPRVPVLEEWTPPPANEAPPAKHVESLIDMMHAAGKTGVQSHVTWLSYYPEAAWRDGLVEISERTLLRHLGLKCPKVRKGKKRVVCYVVPKRLPKLSVIPSGNVEEEIPFDLPKRVRTGTSVHA